MEYAVLDPDFGKAIELLRHLDKNGLGIGGLVGSSKDLSHVEVNLERVAILRSSIHDLLDRFLTAVHVLQVEQGDPDVETLALLVEYDRLESFVGHVSSLVDLGHLQIEDHVFDPQNRLIRP